MSVESFDPAATGASVDEATVERLLQAASEAAPEFGLSALERAHFASLMNQAPAVWGDAAAKLTTEQVESLIRFFTLAEESISGWQSGAKSPVIPLVKALKARGDYQRELTQWIKANTGNRFLPHGSLMDRL